MEPLNEYLYAIFIWVSFTGGVLLAAICLVKGLSFLMDLMGAPQSGEKDD
jgi:hypothetical protein